MEDGMQRLLCLAPALVLAMGISVASGQGPVLPGIPGPMAWQNRPLGWEAEPSGSLSITAGKQTDWFVSPMDGARRDSSPRLLFQPADDFVLSTRVTVDFRSQWDAGVLALYVDDATWAKLCVEMTVEKHPAIVSVVTKTLSDDNNSIAVSGPQVYLKIAKAGQAIFFYASEDGQNWKIIRAFSFGQDVRVRTGFSSQSPIGEKCRTVFDRISYRRNAWTCGLESERSEIRVRDQVSRP
jgi:regulation of enolase protein 1 (concanavalin A-like superfamily)